jgi:hypothetical protein
VLLTGEGVFALTMGTRRTIGLFLTSLHQPGWWWTASAWPSLSANEGAVTVSNRTPLRRRVAGPATKRGGKDARVGIVKTSRHFRDRHRGGAQQLARDLETQFILFSSVHRARIAQLIELARVAA